MEHEPTDNKYKSKEHVGERSIVFRVAYYFQQKIYKNIGDKELTVDCEYNRFYNCYKQIPSHPAGFAPDLILHKRNSVEKDKNIH